MISIQGKSLNRWLLAVHLLGSLVLVAGCSAAKIGDVEDVQAANELAIACRTDEALAAIARAIAAGGLAASIGELQRVVILRDAGRTAEADAAMAARNQRWDADADNIAGAEKAVAESIAELRAERRKRTGHRTCD